MPLMESSNQISTARAMDAVRAKVEADRSPSPRSAGRTARAALAVLLLCVIAVTAALANPYPDRPIKFVVPFTAGGGTDVTARLVAEQLSSRLGQPIIIENRPGASGSVGASMVARTAPNGYTILVGTATLATNMVVSGRSGAFDPVKDFEFIGKLGRLDLILMVNARSGLEDLQGLVKLMQAKRGTVTFGSPGVGSPAHLAGELFKQLTKTDALHVPYKGESAALNDLLGDHTTFQFCAPNVCVPRIKDGALKGLAVASAKRSKMAPQIPTASEAGVPGLEASTWYYLAAPKGTSPDIVKKLNEALNQVLEEESLRTRLLQMGVEVEPGTTPTSVKAGLLQEMIKWKPVVEAAGIKGPS
jgi:tripartite-type tricarboxylate transporter receptor subunit TctC